MLELFEYVMSPFFIKLLVLCNKKLLRLKRSYLLELFEYVTSPFFCDTVYYCITGCISIFTHFSMPVWLIFIAHSVRLL